MFFKIYIGVISLAILIGCILAIVACTSHGTAWLQGIFRRDPGDDGPAGPAGTEGPSD